MPTTPGLLQPTFNADCLDDQHGSYYATASSLGDYVPINGYNSVLAFERNGYFRTMNVGAEWCFLNMGSMMDEYSWGVQANGKMWWGDGNEPGDTNLYRASLGTLQTDSQFIADTIKPINTYLARDASPAVDSLQFRTVDNMLVTVKQGIITSVVANPGAAMATVPYLVPGTPVGLLLAVTYTEGAAGPPSTVTATTTSYTPTGYDRTITMNVEHGVVLLPLATGSDRVLTIKCPPDIGSVAVTRSGSDLIDGVASIDILSAQSLSVQDTASAAWTVF
jgi:hypothetical protein